MSRAYDADFYSWAVDQADALKRRSTNELDWDNLAEELEGLSRSEARELRSRYIVLLVHLMKWIVQPERRSKSWQASIVEQRRRLALHLRENPGLSSREPEIFDEAFSVAMPQVARQTKLDLDSLPTLPPFTLEQAKNEQWLPE